MKIPRRLLRRAPEAPAREPRPRGSMVHARKAPASIHTTIVIYPNGREERQFRPIKRMWENNIG